MEGDDEGREEEQYVGWKREGGKTESLTEEQIKKLNLTVAPCIP